MGHLTRIANTVVQNLEKGHVQSQISDLIRGRSASLSLSLSPCDASELAVCFSEECSLGI